jgi:hypothetical protein
MEYATPQLTLVGRAVGIVLGGTELQPIDSGNFTPERPRTSDGDGVD